MITSEGEATALHRKYGSNEKIIEHCRTVAKVAMILVEEFEKRGYDVDKNAVFIAAMLHDIGRSRVQTVSHGLEGADIAEKEGTGKKVAEIIRRHVGAGISPEEARALAMPNLDYIPRTLEERIVCFADKMVDGVEVRPFEEEVKRFTAKKHDVVRLIALRESLRKELRDDPEKAVFDNVK